MMKKLGITLMLSSAMGLVQAADVEEPVLFSADLTLVPNAATVPASAPVPYYPNECAKLAPPGSPANARGKAVLMYFPKNRALKYAIAFSGLSGPPMMAHYHSSATSATPIVQTLCGKPPPDVNNLGHSGAALNGKSCPLAKEGFLSGEYVLKGNASLKLTPEQEVQQLMNGELFLNFHTCLNMPGEIKGQILKAGAAAK